MSRIYKCAECDYITSVLGQMHHTLLCKSCHEKQQPDEQVKDPKHYDWFPNTNVLTIMATSSTEAEWRGFCRNTALKYRLRLGKKDDLEQELSKADNYCAVFEQYKHLCRGDDES